MEETNKVVVTLNSGVDVDAFIDEMINHGNISPHVPARAVDISNYKVDSNRNTDFILTYQEMEELSKDSRIMGVRWGTKAENGIAVGLHALRPIQTYTKNTTYLTDNIDKNWGIVESSNIGSPMNSTASITRQIPYALDGTGVDILIQDSGIVWNHPEFLREDGTSRVQRIDWNAGASDIQSYSSADGYRTITFSHETNLEAIPVGSYVLLDGFRPTDYNQYRVLVTASTTSSTTVRFDSPRSGPPTRPTPAVSYGAIYSFPNRGYVSGFPNWYTDTDGHGTNVSTIAAGKTYGWATNANIYFMPIPDELPILFQLAKAWHLNKPIDPVTGYRRPTIVNMSWGYYFTAYNDIIAVNYRGTQYNQRGYPQAAFGIVQGQDPRAPSGDPDWDGNRPPTEVISVKAEVEECVAAGMIMVGAAGNSSYKIDVPGGTDYNNYAIVKLNNTDYTWNYHRGDTPGSTPGVICVGAIGTTSNQKASFSCSGPRIDVYAPGGEIAGGYIQYSIGLGGITFGKLYPGTNNFYMLKISGTSQASPQVAGVLACVAGMRPWMTPADALAWIQENSINKIQNDSVPPVYGNFLWLNGSPNRYLYFPYQGLFGTISGNAVAAPFVMTGGTNAQTGLQNQGGIAGSFGT